MKKNSVLIAAITRGFNRTPGGMLRNESPSKMTEKAITGQTSPECISIGACMNGMLKTHDPRRKPMQSPGNTYDFHLDRRLNAAKTMLSSFQNY
jgi:hypothetical protein